MKSCRIASIVISAGYSSRMDAFKPLLKFGKITAVEAIINSYKSSGIENIYVVVGHKKDDIMQKLKNENVHFIVNEDFHLGMFSSIKKGVTALDKDIDAFFIQPVDIPLIKPCTLQILKNEYENNNKGILYPTFYEKKGHPPLIDSKYIEIIKKSLENGGLKRVLEDFQQDSLCIPVINEGILMDMDTKEDYQSLLNYYMLGSPNKAECYAILNKYQVPAHIVRHCEKVATVVLDIYGSIESAEVDLNKNRIYAAALLHDIARKKKNHAKVGAEILTHLGYKEVGNIIETHMDIDVEENSYINENELLFLADKLVKEDTVCNIHTRFKKCLIENKEYEEIYDKIKKRYLSTKRIINKIERIRGKKFDYGTDSLSC
jgi:CTP:molybdopterin cytidylyltransferase MocA/HD superfamily phosphohydrolase YqeK